MLRRIFPLVSLLLVVSGLTACVGSAPFQRPDVPGTVNGNGLARKRVVDKMEPVYLVAADGTECTVTEKRFRETRVGDMVLCMWTGGR